MHKKFLDLQLEMDTNSETNTHTNHIPDKTLQNLHRNKVV